MTDCIAPLYLPSSYNGVFYECMVAGSEHGRRGVTGEFPFGEQTAFQDMGIKIRHYSITGRFKGPECASQMASLIAAVETPGPGTLVHPTRGVLTVSCTSLKVKDDIIQAAGETNFDMEFVDASSFKTGLGSLPIIPSISDFISSITDAFADQYNPAGLLFFQTGAVSATAQGTLVDLAAAFYQSIPGNSDDTVWTALQQIQAASTNYDTWKTAAGIVNNVTFAFAAIDTFSSDPQSEYNVCVSLANKYALSANALGVAGSCQEACYSLMRSLSAAYMMRSATQISNLNLQTALANLDQTATIIEEEKKNALALGNDDLYLSLAAFQAVMLQALSQYAYNLPPTISYTYPGGIASLVAAYDIYGDAAQFVALEAQNPNNFPFALGPVIYASSQPVTT
jgi:prophage DNA circulation protein